MAVPRVRVRVQRSGGFAGVPMHAEADSDRLDPADADRLRHLVARAELDAAPAHSGVVPDSLRYEVDVWRGSEHVHLTARDPGLPAGLRDLLGWLQARAQPGGRRSP